MKIFINTYNLKKLWIRNYYMSYEELIKPNQILPQNPMMIKTFEYIS